MDLGAAGYITKPLKRDDLLRAIELALVKQPTLVPGI